MKEIRKISLNICFAYDLFGTKKLLKIYTMEVL